MPPYGRPHGVYAGCFLQCNVNALAKGSEGEHREGTVCHGYPSHAKGRIHLTDLGDEAHRRTPDIQHEARYVAVIASACEGDNVEK